MKRLKVVSGVLFALAGIAAGAKPPPPETIQNLRAFARLYGYVRFFHPSDEASDIDWDRFAIYGAGRVRDCASEPELETALNQLFLPLAPLVQIRSETAKFDPVSLPSDTTGLVPVAWRHRGVGLDPSDGIFRSLRSNRVPSDLVCQQTDVPAPTAKRVRLRVWARTAGEKPRAPAGLWLSVARQGIQYSEFTNLVACTLASHVWRRYEATATLPEDSLEDVRFGAYPGGADSLWLDDFEVTVESVAGRWKTVEITDSGFEDSAAQARSKPWQYVADWRKWITVTKSARRRNKCLLIQSDTTGFFAKAHLEPGEYVDKALDRGLNCRLPLCLYSDARHTLPRADSAAFLRLRAGIAAVEFDSVSGRRLDVRLGDVTIAWNVIQHFFPYFDIVAVDWDTVLTAGFRNALADTDEIAFRNTLRRMAAALQDGHAIVNHSSDRLTRLLPCKLDLVEGRLVVVASLDTSRFRRGDVLLTINDVPAESVLAEQAVLAPGAPHFKRARAMFWVLFGRPGSTARMRIERDSDTLDLQVVHDAGLTYDDEGDSIRLLEPGIWYVDLDRADMAAIAPIMNKLANARGVVFDLRTYPKNAVAIQLLPNLLKSRDTALTWMQTPEIVRPDRERIVGWQKRGYGLEPAQPRISGKVVILTGNLAASAAETFLSFIQGYKLGEIVGQPTAGTDGAINPFDLPGGYTFSWSGNRVVKLDGSQLQVVGIQPTVTVERTLKALREGRDEYIEKAVELIKS